MVFSSTKADKALNASTSSIPVSNTAAVYPPQLYDIELDSNLPNSNGDDSERSSVNQKALVGASDQDMVSNYEEHVRRAGAVSSITNLSNCIVGAGVIALPLAFASAGWALGITLLVIGASASVFGFYLLSACAHEIGGTDTSFGLLAWRTWPRSSLLVDIVVMMETLGVAIAQLIIVGDLAPKIMYAATPVSLDSFWLKRQLWVSIAFFCLGAPLTCIRRMHGMRITSMMALVGLVFILLLGILHLANPNNHFEPCQGRVDMAACKGEITPAVWEMEGIRRAFSMFVFAFGAHAQVFHIYNEMTKPSAQRMSGIAAFSVTYGFVLYASFGLCGYFTYGSQVSSNVLLDFPNTIPVNISRAIVCFNVCVAYPLANRPTRQAAIHLINTVLDMRGRSQLTANKVFQGKLFWVVTAGILFTTYITAMFVSDLGLVFEAMGATNATMISYILPGVFYLRLFRDVHRKNVINRVTAVAALCLSVFGISFMGWFLATVGL